MAGFIPDKTTHLTVAIASAATTATFSQNDRLAIISSTNCWIMTGSAPTAAANTGVFVPANVPMVIWISTNGFKIAAIRATADGDLTISQAIGE